MASESPQRPKLLKGAFVVYPPQNAGAQPKIIAFQYNPDQLSRTLEKRTVEKKGGGGAKEDVLRTQGPPMENIKLTVQMTAADQLAEAEKGDVVAENGLLPALSTLDMLLYPTAKQLTDGISKGKKGQAQFSEWELPTTLLVWGKSRVVPVLLKSFSITEEAFDTALNPIQAKVELGLQVLTPMELKEKNPGYGVFMSYLQRKAELSAMYPLRD